MEKESASASLNDSDPDENFEANSYLTHPKPKFQMDHRKSNCFSRMFYNQFNKVIMKKYRNPEFQFTEDEIVDMQENDEETEKLTEIF